MTKHMGWQRNMYSYIEKCTYITDVECQDDNDILRSRLAEIGFGEVASEIT